MAERVTKLELLNHYLFFMNICVDISLWRVKERKLSYG